MILPSLNRSLFGVLFILFSAHSFSDVEYIDTPMEGVELGLGWDSTTGTVRPGRCVRFAPVQEGGQSIKLDLSEVSDSSELAEVLDISGVSTLSAFGGTIGIGAQYVHNNHVNTTSSTFALHASVQNGAMFAGPLRPVEERRFAFSEIEHNQVPLWMKDLPDANNENSVVQLDEWALDLLDENNGQEKFRQHCGDHFISNITSGAEILATISFYSKTKEIHDELSAIIEAEYSMASLDTEAHLDTDENASSSKMKVSFLQIGGAEGEIPTTQDDLRRKLRVLAKEAAEAPVFYEMGISHYSDLPNWPEDLSPSIYEQNSNLDKLLAQRDLELASLYASVTSVIEKPEDYTESASYFSQHFSLTKLRSIQDQIIILRRVIHDYQTQRFEQETQLLAFNNTTVSAKTHIEALTPLSKIQPPLKAPPKTKLSPDSQQMKHFMIEYFRGLDTLAMRLELPLPVDQYSNDTPVELAKKTLQHYIYKQTKRECNRRPNSANCLTNSEITNYQTKVPYYPKSLHDFEENRGFLLINNPNEPSCFYANPYNRSEIKLQMLTDFSDLSQCVLVHFRSNKNQENEYYYIETDYTLGDKEMTLKFGSDFSGFTGFAAFDTKDTHKQAMWKINKTTKQLLLHDPIAKVDKCFAQGKIDNPQKSLGLFDCTSLKPEKTNWIFVPESFSKP